jgi:hypothetical protein
MRLVAIALCALVACGGKAADSAVDQYINKDFAPTHAKILAGRKAYGDVNAADVDEPGKLAFLRFRIAEVAAPFLAQALDESRTITPPPAAKAFHEYTIAVLTDEAPALAAMATALSPVDAAAFKAAHARMMEVQGRVITWEEFRTRLLSEAHVELGPLPKVSIPEPKQPMQKPAELH